MNPAVAEMFPSSCPCPGIHFSFCSSQGRRARGVNLLMPSCLVRGESRHGPQPRTACKAGQRGSALHHGEGWTCHQGGRCCETRRTSRCGGKRNSRDTALRLSWKTAKASNSDWRATCKLGIFSPAKSFACSAEGVACDKNIYILKISALTSVKLESREGVGEVRRVGIINQNVVLPLIKSTNLFVTKPLWVDGKRRGRGAAAA